jgi:hypothetical protein
LLYAHDLAERDAVRDRRERIQGALEYPEPDYVGCRLMPRCPLALPQCAEPQHLVELRPGHAVRCWRATSDDATGIASATPTPENLTPAERRSETVPSAPTASDEAAQKQRKEE